MGTLLRELIQIPAHFHQGGFVLKLADEVRERQGNQRQMALRADARFGDVLERRPAGGQATSPAAAA